MSKFFEALERAERGEVLGTEAPSSRPATGTSPSLPPAAPSRGVEPAAPPHLGRPVVEAPAAVTKPRVDRPNRAEDHLVSLFDSESWEAEQYRVLRHAVETLRKGVNLQIVAVTSAAVGDGKTTTAINLAGALAQSADARVLLVDVDLRRPAVARHLGLGGSKGSLVGALLDSGLTLEAAVERLANSNLSVLPAGRATVAPYELLKSPRLEALFEEMRQHYDYVVLDTPPFLPVPDCRLIEKCIDGFLLVVAAHRTPRGAVAETLNLMDPAKVVGAVFNGDDARRSNYYDVYARPSAARWRRAWSKP